MSQGKAFKRKSKLDKYEALIMSMVDSKTKKNEMLSYLQERGLTVSRMQLYRWLNKKNRR